jgi:hypothetical protein
VTTDGERPGMLHRRDKGHDAARADLLEEDCVRRAIGDV